MGLTHRSGVEKQIKQATLARSAIALLCLSTLTLAALLGTGTSAGAEQACPNEASRQGASAVLSECRAYEMVSPPEKLGSNVTIEASRTRASVDGSAVQFISLGAFADARGTGIATEYMAERGAGAWQTHAITPLHNPQSGEQAFSTFDPRYVGELSGDLSVGVYVSKTALSGGAVDGNEVRNLYLRRDLHTPGAGSYELLTKGADAPAGFGYVGASADFSHVVFAVPLNLTPDAPPLTCPVPGSSDCDRRVYEFTQGEVRLVNLIPVAPTTSCSGVDCVPAVRAIPGNAFTAPEKPIDAVSQDGRRIFFTVTSSANSGGAGVLYMREDGDTTIQLNVSEPGNPLSGPAEFRAASRDGSKAFFTSGRELYRYDLDAPTGERLTLLSADHEPGDSPGAFGVRGVYGISADGSYAYFSSDSQLVEGGPPVEAGEVMVYVWHDNAVAFVGTVKSDPDDVDNKSIAYTLRRRFARVTPDGKHLLFVSSSPNQPTRDSSAECSGVPCSRLYVYSADANGGAGVLACASCRPDGAPSTSDATTAPRVSPGGAVPDSHLNRAISDDGHLVFFSTGDRLVPEDTNGRYDAYAYDTTTGRAHLISSGRCNCDSYFLEASADGGDVFFATNERLVGWDVDNLTDLYDARVNGGLAEPPLPPPSCQGDACQPPPIVRDRPPRSSAVFQGPGNQSNARPKARKCPKGKRRVKARGKTRCVKRADGHRKASR